MDFSEALKLLKEGAVLRRDSWNGNKRIVLMPGSKNLTSVPHRGIITKDERRGVDTATNCDILADDWVLFK